MVGHLWAICTAPTPLHKPSEESACYGEIAPDLGKLFWRVGFLGRVVGPVRQDGAMEDWRSTGRAKVAAILAEASVENVSQDPHPFQQTAEQYRFSPSGL